MLKIIEKHIEGEYNSAYELKAIRDGKEILSLYASDLSECPEDAILGRSLNFAYDVINFFKLGYEAAKNNEEVIYESETVKEED